MSDEPKLSSGTPRYISRDTFTRIVDPRFFIRVSAFVRKEIFETIRQPRLILTLVLSPFLILFLFGIGFRNEPRPLRTLFVVAEGSPIRDEVEYYGSRLGGQLIYAGIVDDEAEARTRLERDEVDLVAVTPFDAYERILNNQQAVFHLYHYETDPFQVDYIRLFGRVYIDEVNRRVLQSITEQSKTDAASLQKILTDADTSTAILQQALTDQDTAQIQTQLATLDQNIDTIELAVGTSIGLLVALQDVLDIDLSSDPDSIVALLEQLNRDVNELNKTEVYQGKIEQVNSRVNSIRANLAQLNARLNEFQRIDSAVIVRPFRSEVESISPIQPQVSDFYAPAVIILLLQHLTVTFAALSMVRESRLGTMELFRVAPISAGETLIGKYISYLIFGTVIGLMLTATLVLILCWG